MRSHSHAVDEPPARTAQPAAPLAGVTFERVSHRINAERLVLFGWTRAILLQFAHPLVAAGIFEHSAFRQSPLIAVRRLHHTVGSMLAIAFGEEAARARTIDAIRAIHRRVNGQLQEAVGPFAAGTPYSAEDPDLLLWVHATLLESVPLVYERFVGPLSEAEHDVYCEDAAAVAVALGARSDEVPRTRAALQAYLARMYASGRIVVGRTARTLAHALLQPRGRMLVAPAVWVNDLLTVSLLPDHIRRQYGFRWDARRERRLVLATRGVRVARRAAPNWVALWRDARR
jgi:uncharacterized protein (DUF2236 family)